MQKKLIFKNIEETRAFGASLAAELEPGDVIALSGDLGTGKTTLTKAVAEALGVKSAVTSPTFTIVREHDEGRIPLYHFDLYRVHDEDELFEIGFDDYLHGNGVCLIEWAELIDEDILPPGTCFITLEYGGEENERICTIRC